MSKEQVRKREEAPLASQIFNHDLFLEHLAQCTATVNQIIILSLSWSHLGGVHFIIVSFTLCFTQCASL